MNFILLIFVGKKTDLTERILNLQKDISTKYGQILTPYVITNNYDISKHDDNPNVL